MMSAVAALKLILIMLIFTGRRTSTLLIGWRPVAGTHLPNAKPTADQRGHRREHRSVPELPRRADDLHPCSYGGTLPGHEDSKIAERGGS
jgi:hypothetical protein